MIEKEKLFEKSNILSLFNFFGLKADFNMKPMWRFMNEEIVFRNENNKPVSVAVIEKGVGITRNLILSDLLYETLNGVTFIVNHNEVMRYEIRYPEQGILEITINKHDVTIKSIYIYTPNGNIHDNLLEFFYDEVDNRYIRYLISESGIQLSVGYTDRVLEEYLLIDPIKYRYTKYQINILKELCNVQLKNFDFSSLKNPIYESIILYRKKTSITYQNLGIDLFFSIVRCDKFLGYFNRISQELDCKIPGVKEYIENTDVFKNIFVNDYVYIRKDQQECLNKVAQEICSKFF